MACSAVGRIIEPAHAKTRLSDMCLKLRKTDLKFFVDFAAFFLYAMDSARFLRSSHGFHVTSMSQLRRL